MHMTRTELVSSLELSDLLLVDRQYLAEQGDLLDRGFDPNHIARALRGESSETKQLMLSLVPSNKRNEVTESAQLLQLMGPQSFALEKLSLLASYFWDIIYFKYP